MNLAVGFFDGVHIGHRRILANADAALTFLEHPASVFAPDRVPPLLMPQEERIAAIAAALASPANIHSGRVRALHFTPALAAQSPEDFTRWLRETYPDLGTVFCGPNWTFGAGGAGTADTLRASGLSVETVPFVLHDGTPVSSTRIRAALTDGRLDDAAALLGRRYSVTGESFIGKGLGRTIGRPTINLRLPPGIVGLPLGVYAVETPLGAGVANYGLAPTTGERAWTTPTLEVHLLDAPAAVSVPASLPVTFCRHIRPERKFDSIEALKKQIALDAAAARRPA